MGLRVYWLSETALTEIRVPIYEYRCKDEGHRFEVFQRMSDDPVTVCSVCGGTAERVLFAPAIHFKGSGFHNTDYATKKRPRDESAGSGDGAPASGAADGAKVKEATPADTAARATGP